VKTAHKLRTGKYIKKTLYFGKDSVAVKEELEKWRFLASFPMQGYLYEPAVGFSGQKS